MMDPTPGHGKREIVYIAVTAFPETLERLADWVNVVLHEHPHMLGMRAVVDMSQVDPDRTPPAGYVENLVDVMRPLMEAARQTRCAILVPEGPLFWRARLFETLSSQSRVQFRAFHRLAEAMEWLGS